MRVDLRGLVLVLILSLLATLASADDLSLLWQNKHADARTAFKAAVQKNPADARAVLGTALLNTLEDVPGAAAQSWRRYYQLAPASWQAMAYWQQMVDTVEDTGQWALLDGAAQDIVAAKAAPPALRASARLVQAAAADRAGKYADAEKIWAQLGFLRQWQIIGPFDNVSRSGFAKVYPPEREIDFTKTYPGIDDQVLGWHALGIVTRDGNCLVGTALGSGQDAVYYAVTAVFSPKAQPVLLCADYDGAVKLILNGLVVFADDRYRESHRLTADPYQAPAQLQGGWNTLLVKLADDEDSLAGFRLRCTTPAGEDLAGLQVDPAQAKMPAGIAGAVPTPPPAETAAVALVRKQPKSIETALALGHLLRRSGDYAAALTVLKEALAQAPESGWLHWELSRVYGDDDQPDEARAEREQANKRNPALLEAALYQLEEQQELTPDEKIKQLKGLAEKFPGSPSVRWGLYYTYLDAEMVPEALQAVQDMIKLTSGASLVYEYVDILWSHARHADAEKALTAALQKDPLAEPLLSLRADKYAEQGKTADAIAVYQRILQYCSPAPWYRRRMANLYIANKDLKQAAKALEIIRQQCPQDADVCASLADVLRDQQRAKEAVELYKAAIALDPSRVELREKVQVVGGEQPVMNLAPATPVEPILEKAKTTKSMPGASVYVLLDEARQVVYPDYATDMRVHRIIKIFDAAGVEGYQHVSFDRGTSTARMKLEKARLIKADGKIEDLSDKSDNASVSCPSLAPGDIIDIAYRVSDYHPGALARQFWTAWMFPTPDAPVALSRYTLITPQGMAYRAETHGQVPEPSVKAVDGWSVREWKLTDIPITRMEMVGTSLRDAEPWLDISTITSWSDIVRWYRDLAGPRCVPDATVRAKAAELTKDAKTEEEKIRALVTFVTETIQYQSMPFRLSRYVPTEGKEVLRDGYGDCKDKAALLTALLDAVGIKAEMVLLSGRDEGLTPFLPSPRFTHAITRIHTTQGPRWVDATAENMPFGGFPNVVQGVPALIIDEATTELTQTPTQAPETNYFASHYTTKLDAEGQLTGEVVLDARNNWGWMLRSLLQQVPENQHTTVLRTMATQLVKGSIFEKGALDNLPEPEKPLLLHFTFHLENYTAPVGNFLPIKLPWYIDIGMLDVVISDPGRKHDLEIASSYGYRQFSVRMEVPAGYTPEGLPEKVEKTSPWGKYTITYTMDGNVLSATCDLWQTVMRVPTRDLPKFQQYLRSLKQDVGKQVLLKKA